MPERKGPPSVPDVFVVCACGLTFTGDACWPLMWAHMNEQIALDDPGHFAERAANDMRFLNPKVNDD